jgi:hypothetical protein
MLFVAEKRKLQAAISIVRDDRKKKTQCSSGPFMRLEANDGCLELSGQEVSAKIPATVYEPGVLFLKITVFRRLLRSITGEQFITIQITADELLLDKVRLPLHANEMLLYPTPKDAPLQHPSIRFEEKSAPPQKPLRSKKRKPHDDQLLLWEEDRE